MAALWRRAARWGLVVVCTVGACAVTGACAFAGTDHVTVRRAGAPARVVLAAFPAAGAGLAATPTVKDCDFGFVPAAPTVGVGSIIGTAWAQCDVPPDTHELVVSLQRLDGGWQTIASAPPDPRIPPGPPQRAAYQVKTVCTPGAWRVSATATGSLQGRTGSLTDNSLVRVVSQQDCDRGKK